LTSGPHDDPTRAINVGVAAHITAASLGGPRYDLALSPEERGSVDNGIWLCQTCGKLVDSDDSRFTVASLNGWKRIAEAMARGEIEQRRELTAEGTQKFQRAERLMSALLKDMRKDLADSPLSREFVILRRTWSYWPGGNEFGYYLDDYPNLDGMIQVLENLELIRDVTRTNVKRYRFTEELVDYLITTTPRD